MSIFESSIMAWHDTLLTHEGVQDPFEPSVSSTKPGGFAEIYDAELVKVRKAIRKLDKVQREVGDWCYGPKDNSNTYHTSRARVMHRLYRRYLARQGIEFVWSCTETHQVLIMAGCAVDCLQHRASSEGKPLLSHAEVAHRLKVAKSTFSEKFSTSYEDMIEHGLAFAKAALTEIDPVVNEINAKYRRAS